MSLASRYNADESIMEPLRKKYGPYFHFPEDPALAYGEWIINNCIVTRNGFRCAKVDGWKEEISNEEAYDLYLESLKEAK